jgi:SAM-dependent methyltransferase
LSAPSILPFLDRFCCPRCRFAPEPAEAGLVAVEGALRCTRCGESFPVASGVCDLRGEEASRTIDRKAVAFYERVYGEESYGREAQDEHAAPLREMAALAPDGALVLELGTGLGALQGVHESYVGTDLSVEALVKWIRKPAFASDARRLPLRDGSVDFLFTIAVLEHIPRPEESLVEIERVIRPGGRAYLAPAWNCRPWAAEGLHVRSYGELTAGQRLRKATIPLRDSLAWRGAFAIPKRIARRLGWTLRRRPTRFRYRRLEPNFEVFWASDSDATAQLDPHETALYFESRGWVVEQPPTVLGRLFHRAQPLVIRRPRDDAR